MEDNLNHSQNDQSKTNHLTEKSLGILRSKYAIIGKRNIRSWQAFLAVGLVAGVLGGIIFVANKNVKRLESEGSEAAIDRNVPIINVLVPNGGEKWETGKVYTVSWKIINSDKIGNNGIMMKIVRKSDPKFNYIENISMALSSTRMINAPSTTYQYQFKVPDFIKSADDYGLIIYLSNKPLANDRSDGLIAITNPSAANPSLSFSLNATSPSSGQIVPTKNSLLASFDLVAGSSEDINVSSLTIYGDGTGNSNISDIILYDASTNNQIGSTVAGFADNQAIFSLKDLVIVAGFSKTIYVKANTTLATNPLKIVLTNVLASGNKSGQTASTSGLPVLGNWLTFGL